MIFLAQSLAESDVQTKRSINVARPNDGGGVIQEILDVDDLLLVIGNIGGVSDCQVFRDLLTHGHSGGRVALVSDQGVDRPENCPVQRCA